MYNTCMRAFASVIFLQAASVDRESQKEKKKRRKQEREERIKNEEGNKEINDKRVHSLCYRTSAFNTVS
jgi:hypothetical protein